MTKKALPTEGDLLRLLRPTIFGPKAVFRLLKAFTAQGVQLYLCLQIKPRAYGQNYAAYPPHYWEAV